MRHFTYLITRTDEVARCMDVLYVADGYEPILVGVRAPREGESLEVLLLAAAPTGVWDAIDLENMPLAMPAEFTSGRFSPTPPAEVVAAPPAPEIIMRKREVTL